MTLPDGDEVDSLRARLTELEAERSTLIDRLERLRGRSAQSRMSGVTLARAVVSGCAALREVDTTSTVLFDWRYAKK
jgi:hypothetical protein